VEVEVALPCPISRYWRNANASFKEPEALDNHVEGFQPTKVNEKYNSTLFRVKGLYFRGTTVILSNKTRHWEFVNNLLCFKNYLR
jgi:hypothetical protein